MKYYFIRLHWLVVLQRFKLELIDSRGTRPFGLVRYYKRRGLLTGIRYFTRKRTELESRAN